MQQVYHVAVTLHIKQRLGVYRWQKAKGICSLLIEQGSKLTVVRLSRTTKNVLGQPNNVQWLPKGQPVVYV